MSISLLPPKPLENANGKLGKTKVCVCMSSDSADDER